MLERARTSGTGVVRALERVVVCGAPKYERLAIGSDLGGNQKNRVGDYTGNRTRQRVLRWF